MNVSTIFFLIIGLVILFAVIRLVRNLKLREKYAALWLLTGVVIVILMLFPRMLDWLARVVGVATPVNLLFLIAILLLLGVCLHLSLEISRLEGETRVLAEEAAIQRSLLDRQLERISHDRNPTSSLPRITLGEDGEGEAPADDDAAAPGSQRPAGPGGAPQSGRPARSADRPAQRPTDPTDPETDPGDRPERHDPTETP
ncbi:DUF2304 domain-containing protein [Rothia sp. AR01]|uniref:DUF2304 domain-containing protein n=1 Tax=Rothia santali TaxID=2949643 RepID=A0A9X2HK91_9MICC|nr:DUF2304 domain-containing protein [Rothia santali]MCP3426453.1 DUF2304 domain-containing protein [Rothia santali]